MQLSNDHDILLQLARISHDSHPRLPCISYSTHATRMRNSHATLILTTHVYVTLTRGHSRLQRGRLDCLPPLNTTPTNTNRYADILAFDADGWTAYHLSALRGHDEICDLLRSHGAGSDISTIDAGSYVRKASSATLNTDVQPYRFLPHTPCKPRATLT